MRPYRLTCCLFLVCCGLTRIYAQSPAPLLGMGGSPLQQMKPELKLFEGQKPVTFNQLQATADYAYFQDTAGLGLGVFHNLNGTIAYSVDYSLSLNGMPFTGSVRENNGINTLNYT